MHGIGIGIPAELMQAISSGHQAQRGFAEDRRNLAMSWLDSLDVDGLLSLRWVLDAIPEHAYGNNQYFDGMCVQLLRSKGVDPCTGRDPAAELLEKEALRADRG